MPLVIARCSKSPTQLPSHNGVRCLSFSFLQHYNWFDWKSNNLLYCKAMYLSLKERRQKHQRNCSLKHRRWLKHQHMGTTRAGKKLHVGDDDALLVQHWTWCAEGWMTCTLDTKNLIELKRKRWNIRRARFEAHNKQRPWSPGHLRAITLTSLKSA